MQIPVFTVVQEVRLTPECYLFCPILLSVHKSSSKKTAQINFHLYFIQTTLKRVNLGPFSLVPDNLYPRLESMNLVFTSARLIQENVWHASKSKFYFIKS